MLITEDHNCRGLFNDMSEIKGNNNDNYVFKNSCFANSRNIGVCGDYSVKNRVEFNECSKSFYFTPEQVSTSILISVF